MAVVFSNNQFFRHSLKNALEVWMKQLTCWQRWRLVVAAWEIRKVAPKSIVTRWSGSLVVATCSEDSLLPLPTSSTRTTIPTLATRKLIRPIRWRSLRAANFQPRGKPSREKKWVLWAMERMTRKKTCRYGRWQVTPSMPSSCQREWTRLPDRSNVLFHLSQPNWRSQWTWAHCQREAYVQRQNLFVRSRIVKLKWCRFHQKTTPEHQWRFVFSQHTFLCSFKYTPPWFCMNYFSGILWLSTTKIFQQQHLAPLYKCCQRSFVLRNTCVIK